MQIPIVQNSNSVEKIQKYSANPSFRMKRLFPEPKIALCEDLLNFVKLYWHCNEYSPTELIKSYCAEHLSSVHFDTLHHNGRYTCLQMSTCSGRKNPDSLHTANLHTKLVAYLLHC